MAPIVSGIKFSGFLSLVDAGRALDPGTSARSGLRVVHIVSDAKSNGPAVMAAVAATAPQHQAAKPCCAINR